MAVVIVKEEGEVSGGGGLSPLVSMVYLFNRNVFDSCKKS